MRPRSFVDCVFLGAVRAAFGIGTLVLPIAPREARADEARVLVKVPEDDGFAQPPERDAPPRDACEPREADCEPYGRRARELYRAPLRLSLGPAFVTTGRGLGVGLGVAADIGTGTVGFRLSSAWTRNEASAASGSPLGDGLGQYTGELTLDLHKRGPWHPVVAVGVGLAHVNRESGGGNAAVGTARVGFEYAIFVEDADVRFGAGILGALTGPTDHEVADLRGYVLFGGALTIGF